MSAYNCFDIANTLDLFLCDPLGFYSDFLARLSSGGFSASCLELLEELAEFIRTEPHYSTIPLVQLVLRFPPYGRLDPSDISGDTRAYQIPLPSLEKDIREMVGTATEMPAGEQALDLMRRFGYELSYSEDLCQWGWLTYSNPFGFSNSLRAYPRFQVITDTDEEDDDTDADPE